ncbi:MAG: hypothetical protein ACSLE6_14575 [Mycobacterium sp.]
MQIRSSLDRDARGRIERASITDTTPETADEATALARPVGSIAKVTIDRTQPRLAPARFPSPAPLFAGCPSLFLQTSCGSKLAPAAALVAVEETGLLLTLGSGAKDRARVLRQGVSQCRTVMANTVPDRAVALPMLADANRYSGKNRAIATASGPNLDPAWISVQRGLGLPVALTDSPYVPAGEHVSLATLLSEAHGLGAGVVAVLPLHLDWLKKDVTSLTTAINEAGVPVALVLEHSDDPLGVQDAVAGLVHLLQSAQVKVALLRCDISVIGAVAFGATFGAIGTTTGLRHLYPTKEKSSGFNRGARIGAYMPRGIVYRALDTLNTAIALDPDNQERWNCACERCYGRPLSRIHDEIAAYEHSLAAIAALAEEVLVAPSALHRQHAWIGRCSLAQVTNLEIAAETGLNWATPKFQGAWRKLGASLPPLP